MTSKDIQNITEQAQVVAEIHDLLHVGTFQGGVAQKVLMGQAYLKGLHGQIKAEIKRMEEQLGDEMKPTFTEALKTEIAK